MSKIIKNRKSEELREYPKSFTGSFERDKYTETLNYLYSGIEDSSDDMDFFNQMFYTNIVGSKSKFMLGRFYIFDYLYPTIDEREFIDIRPLVFILDDQRDGQKRRIKGINFNFLDEASRINFLQIYFNIYKNIIDNDLWFSERGEYRIYKILYNELEVFYKSVVNIFPNISRAIRYWDFDRMGTNSVDVVRLDDYNILFQYTGYIDSIKGRYWADVQNEFMNKK